MFFAAFDSVLLTQGIGSNKIFFISAAAIAIVKCAQLKGLSDQADGTCKFCLLAHPGGYPDELMLNKTLLFLLSSGQGMIRSCPYHLGSQLTQI